MNNISLLNCTYIIEYFLGAALTIEGDISEHHPCLWCYVDGKMKMNLSFEDKFVLDISIINDAKIKTYLNFPSARIRGTVYKSPWFIQCYIMAQLKKVLVIRLSLVSIKVESDQHWKHV